jgi:hypothetical protein
MYTSHNPCWDAKNRYGLPEEVPFEYESIRHIIEPDGASRATEVKSPIIQKTASPVKTVAQEPKETSIAKEEPVQQEMDLQQPPASMTAETTEGPSWVPDGRIPKALRDLMIANNVCEWDIQGVCEAKGYFPGDMQIWEYPKDFIEGCLVGAWEQVYGAIREMKKKEAIPFN